MSCYSLIFTIVVIFNYLISVTLAENKYYIIGIKRSDNDTIYDDESIQVQQSIDKLVNDRMNDIYNIIIENKDTYTLENGKMDEKLKELNHSNLLKKRDTSMATVKFKFFNDKRTSGRSHKLKRSDNLIPLKSEMVDHICPINNYYTIRAYLSDSIVDRVKNLPNIIFCEPSRVSKNNDGYINKPFNGREFNYFDNKMIKKETKWTNAEIQKHDTFQGKNFFSHLSLLSQGRYRKELTEEYDNNYYYPKEAGKGISIYLMDGGYRLLDWDDSSMNSNPSNRDFYCAMGFVKNKRIPVDPYNCELSYRSEAEKDHGNMVMSMAGGALFGVAKKANTYMILTDFNDYDALNAFDYISRVGIPHKTVVSISRFFNLGQAVEDKIDELTEKGIIIVNSAGNFHTDCCDRANVNNFAGFKSTITVGALTFTLDEDMNNVYKVANFSNFGSCVDIFAPSDSIYPGVRNSYISKDYNGYIYNRGSGTSSATPIVAGVIATIMSEHPEIEYTTDSMRKTLIDMSLKDILEDVKPGTPNRFINNGKRVVFSPKKVYNGCGPSSGNKVCIDGCCSADGQCIDSTNEKYTELCSLSRGCQSEFGECLSNEDNNTTGNDTTTAVTIPEVTTITEAIITTTSTTTTTITATTTTTTTNSISINTTPQPTTTLGQRCGPDYGNSSCVLQDSNGKYLHVSCCSKEGVCGLTAEYCGIGCQTDYGRCYAIAFFNQGKYISN